MLKQVQHDGGRGSLGVRVGETVTITPSINRQRRKAKILRQIAPIRIARGHMVDFPLPVPVLQLLLPRNGGLHCAEHFEQNQPLRFVFLALAVEIPVAVLPDAHHQVRCDPDVQRLIVETAHDVDARLEVEAVCHSDVSLNICKLNRHPELVSGS